MKKITNEFNNVSPEGFSNSVNRELKAEDNPEFIAAYKDLLSKNDRVLACDIHTDFANLHWLGSDEHMKVMKDTGVKFILTEFPLVFHSHIEDYESGKINFDEFRDNFIAQSVLFKKIASSTDYKDFLIEGQFNYERFSSYSLSEYLNNEDIIEHLNNFKDNFLDELKSLSNHADIENCCSKFFFELQKKIITYNVEPFIRLVKNAKENGIKVRCFDDQEKEGLDYDEKDENSHIDDPRLRIDDVWDSYIEKITQGEKAVIYVGAGHVATSYGIDEYLEARGHSVGTFRIKNEQDIAEIPRKRYSDPDWLNKLFERMMKKDADDYDPSDFTQDLFYNQKTAEIVKKEPENAVANMANEQNMASSHQTTEMPQPQH